MRTDPHSFDIVTAQGRLRLRRHGRPGAPRLLLCVPGLSANATSWDFVAERLAGDDRQVVAVDLRGRGLSDLGGPFGWEAHARDVLEVAERLRDGRPYDLAGHSMGAFVSLQAVALPGPRPRRLVLMDAAGIPDEHAITPIRAAVQRLGTVFPSAEDYLGRLRALGTIVPWSRYWDRYFAYELEPVQGGVRARTDRDAVLADLAHGQDRDPRALWPSVDMPSLLLRAELPLFEGRGYVLTAEDARDYVTAVPRSRLVEVPANHYTIATHELTATAIAEFLDAAD